MAYLHLTFLLLTFRAATQWENQDLNLILSANAPVINAGVMMANLSWKNANNIKGMIKRLELINNQELESTMVVRKDRSEIAKAM